MMPRINELYARDCIGFMRDLPAGCIDVIVTSPPYNIDKTYSLYRDTKTLEEYSDWMEAVAIESRRVLKDDGSFFLNIGAKPSDVAVPYVIGCRFIRHYVLQNDIIWVKSIAIPKEDSGKTIGRDIAVGHYKPIHGKRYLNGCQEKIFHFTKRGDVKINKLAIGVPYQYKSNIKRFETGGDLRDRGDTWFIPYETVKEAKPHPALFPVKLPEMCIKFHGIKKDMLVYDPFVGIGSTAIACINLGVSYIGTDIDEGYLDIAREQIASHRFK